MQHTTDTTAPSLVELLTARAEERAENARENARRAQFSREHDRAEALAFAHGFMTAHVSPGLADALRMTPAVDDNLIDAGDDDNRYHAWAGYLMLDLRGAGVDGDDDARTDPACDERWSLVYIRLQHRSYRWTLNGPHGYIADIGDCYSTDTNLDSGILDAIAAYPDWLARAEERRTAQLAAEREEERRRQQMTPRRYVFAEGLTPSDIKPGMLAVGNRLHVRVLDPRAESGMIDRCGTLDAYNDRWLLLTLDDRGKGAGAQRLIPIARVQDIRPLPDLAPDLAPDGEAE